MRKPAYHQSGHFTMLEILVATVVLVIMMGFLFQFINSAQKIWSASEITSGIFDQAQLVFNMLEKDLQNLHFVSDQDYPGHAIPMGGYNSENSTNKFFLVTQNSSDTDQIGTCLVMYGWTEATAESGSTGELARYVLDAPLTDSPNPHFFYGYAPPDDQDQDPVSDVLDELEDDGTRRDVLVTGLQTLKIEAMFDDLVNLTDSTGAKYFFNEEPRFLRITLTIHDANAVRALTDSGMLSNSEPVENKKSETARRFSKIIFLR